MKRPAIFLDRDGTLLDERGYLGDPKRVRFYRSAAPALRRLSAAGYRLVIVSNQSGIARGYFTLADFRKVSRRVIQVLRGQGVRIAGVYFCPHMPDGGCPCRKPRPGLGRRAARELNIDLRKSFMVGDQAGDIAFARNLGVRGVLVLTGGGRRARAKTRKWRPKVTSNVATAASWILNPRGGE